MICPFCKSDIEGDSFFCDQCGKELRVCPQCGKPGKGKVCTEHGKKLIPAKERNQPEQKPQQPEPVVTNDQPVQQEEKYVATVRMDTPVDNTEPVKVITFTNNAINVSLALEDNDIIGRKKGRFAGLLGEYKQISGGHAKVEMKGSDWYLTDLDSSNGTRYNGTPLSPHSPVKLENNSRVIFANIEFIVEIKGNIDSDATVRV